MSSAPDPVPDADAPPAAPAGARLPADDAAAAPPGPAVFRISPLTVLVALVFAVCLTPIAGLGPYWWLAYLIPLGIIAWVLWTRTTVDGDALTVRRITGRQRVPWSDISSLRLGRARNPATARVSAVLRDGAELPLPAVHVRDLPRLAAVSGGRLSDPAGG